MGEILSMAGPFLAAGTMVAIWWWKDWSDARDRREHIEALIEIGRARYQAMCEIEVSQFTAATPDRPIGPTYST